MITLGIDPGLSGAIACLIDGELLDVEDMPTFSHKKGKRTINTVAPTGVTSILKDFALAGLGTPTVIIERVHATPQMGVTSSFNFGDGFGCVRAIPLALGFPVKLVEPSTWKKAMGLTADKGASRRLASERWPAMAHLFARVKDDGRAEAALIAAYGLEAGAMWTATDD